VFSRFIAPLILLAALLIAQSAPIGWSIPPPTNSGGGSSSYISSAGNTGTVAMTGSDVVIFTASSVPALASGGCYVMDVTVQKNSTGATATTYNLKVDGTTIQTLATTGSDTFEADHFGFHYCNNVGSQTAQSLVEYLGEYCTACAAGNNWNQTLNVNLPTTPTGVNWATSHTVTITANQASGTVTGLAFRYGL
jgi:hypothetical protein